MTNNNERDFSVLGTWPVSRWEWPKIVVFVPLPQALGYVDEVFPHFIEIARQGVPFLHLPYGFADRLRNEAAKQFLKSEYTHILMLDADHTHQHDIVQRLAKHVIDDPDRLIVGGLNFKRTAPYSPCVCVIRDEKVYRPQEWTPGIAEVDRIGTGCILIAKEAFEQTEFPWFVNEPYMKNQSIGSHDNYFCKIAQEAGIKIWCDFTLTSPHMGMHRITEQTFRTYLEMNPVEDKELIDA